MGAKGSSSTGYPQWPPQRMVSVEQWRDAWDTFYKHRAGLIEPQEVPVFSLDELEQAQSTIEQLVAGKDAGTT